jgi:hypothetical protein
VKLARLSSNETPIAAWDAAQDGATSELHHGARDAASELHHAAVTPVDVGPLCVFRPSRYVSVINDNYLVSLMNFNTAKMN